MVKSFFGNMQVWQTTGLPTEWTQANASMCNTYGSKRKWKHFKNDPQKTQPNTDLWLILATQYQ